MKKRLSTVLLKWARCFIIYFLVELMVFNTSSGNPVNAQMNNVIKENFQNISVRKLFSIINEKTAITFVFDASSIHLDTLVRMNAHSLTATNILDSLSEKLNWSFRQIGNTITVRSNPPRAAGPGRSQRASGSLATPVRSEAARDTFRVTGTVKDTLGMPLPGVTVQVKDAAGGTVTDNNGRYTIDAAPHATLVFSFIGFDRKETSIGGSRRLDVTLGSAASGLNEIVVVGYGTEKRATLSGSIATVSGKEIKDLPVANLSNALAGRLSGVRITQSGGKPGMASSISIRAAGTWNNASPLFVIDGVVRDQFDFDALDPSEVDNISILKDGASAAVYGSRAANGVILVTTRQGKEGKTAISYNGSVGVEKPIHIPEAQNAYNQAITINDALRVDNIPTNDARYYSPDELDYFKTHNWNWIDEAWKNPVTTRHSLSVSGGSPRVRYFMNGAYYYATGSFNKLDFRKNTLRANVEADITNNLTASLNVNMDVRNDQKPYWRYDGDGDNMEDLYKAFLFRTQSVPPYINGKLNGTYVEWSPLAITEGQTGYNKKKFSNYNTIATLRYKVPFVPGLELKVMFNKYSRTSFVKQFSLPYELSVFKRRGDHNHIVTDELESVKVRNDGEFLYESYDNQDAYQLDGYVSYNRSFGSHKLSALLVYEQAESNGNNFNGQRNNFVSPAVDQLFAGSAASQFANGSGWEDGRVSYIGRLNYNYGEKYILEGAFRYDGSVKFSPPKRWGFFPSLSAVWRISEEPFFKDNVRFVNDLKLRSTIALIGNDAVGGWQWMQRYNVTNGAVFGSITSGVAPGSLSNADITWEKSVSWNGGLDAYLLNGKLNFSADVFRTHTYDILGPRQQSVPSTFGATLPAENYGIVNARGFELSARYNGAVNKHFSYYVSGNFGYATNEVKVRDQPANQRAYKSIIGYNMDRIWGYEATGIIRTQADLDALPAGYTIFGQKPELGMLNYRDLRGAVDDKPDGKIDENDAQYIASHSTPPVNYGIGMGCTWKGLSLDLLLQGLAGSNAMIDVRYIQARTEETNFAYWNDHWTPGNPNAAFPRAARNTADNASTFWLRNSSFLRLKNVNLSYDLPRLLVKRSGLAAVRVFFIGTNLWLLEDHVKVRDPEAASMRSYPLMKNYTFGLNITL
ncbi:SusC/RagA family TonB-linked outer membrane protein [Chitinophaga sp. Ak27]|uniref:SusC/RagA family TonB-linked outer membrane protein n=1 Tax=Chitinophaga sp. Ak27 TaxID=2726116 RepID=UPI00145FBE0D|nr:TonB-dependent receptor [Chitinophaga sp. Ak27]NLU91530.1 TonB-dependent receptor [Chitinophaga sp. Ak27]